MYLLGLPRIHQVIGTYDITVGDNLGSTHLLFTKQCTTESVHAVGILIVRCYLYEIKRQFTKSELLTPLFHEQFKPFGITISRVAHITASLIENDTFHSIIEDWMEGTITPKERVMIVPAELLGDGGTVEYLIGVFRQIVSVEPTFYARTSFICNNQSNRNIERLIKESTEEIAGSTTVAHRIRANYIPMAVGILQRYRTHHTGYLHIMHAFILRCIYHGFITAFYRTVAETAHGHFHIALSGTYPHFAGKHVLDGYLVTIIKGDGQWCITGFRYIHLNQPVTFAVCLCSVDLFSP